MRPLFGPLHKQDANMNAIATANACNAANNTTIGAIVVTRKIVDKIRRAVVTSHFARSLSTAAAARAAGGSAAGAGAGAGGEAAGGSAAGGEAAGVGAGDSGAH